MFNNAYVLGERSDKQKVWNYCFAFPMRGGNICKLQRSWTRREKFTHTARSPRTNRDQKEEKLIRESANYAKRFHY